MRAAKTCFKCLGTKPSAEFYPHPAMADGLLGKCKTCTKTDVKAHRQAHPEFERARAKLPHRKALAASICARWKEQHPERRAAQVALGNAVRSGRIAPWPVCAMPECNNKPEAHHPDYSRPLDVVWLCPPHHKQAHALARPA